MSAAKRVRLLVAAIAVVAAGAVAGRRPRDAPESVAADGAVQAAADAADRAGRALGSRRRRPGGLRERAEGGRADPRAALPAGAEGSGRAVQLRHRALLRRLRRRRRAGVPPGEEGRLRHLLRDARRRDPAPAVLPAGGRALSDLRAAASEPAPDPGRDPAAPRPAALRREALRAGRAPAPGQRRSPGRGGGRPLRRRRSLGGVLAARPARQALSAQPVGALPPRPAARLDRAARPGDHGVPARARSESDEYTWPGNRARSCAVLSGVGPARRRR